MQILKRNRFEKSAFGFRQNFLQGSFWLNGIHAFWRDGQERPSDDFINRTSDFVFASLLCHLRAVVLRPRSLRGPEEWLVCLCCVVPIFSRKQEMRSSAVAKGGGVVRKVQETLGSSEQLPLWVE